MLLLKVLLTYYLGLEILIVSGRGKGELVSTILPQIIIKGKPPKVTPWPSLFAQEPSWNKPNQVKNTMAPTTSFNINPSRWLLQNSTEDEGGPGKVAVATSAKKRQGKKALKTLKIWNNFGSARVETPRAAKLDGGVSGPQIAGGTPRKRSEDGTPCKKAQGGEESFLFCLDQERAHAAASAKANPPFIAANKHDDPDDRGGGPRHPPRAGMALRSKPSMRTNWTMIRSQAMASGNWLHSEPWRPLPSGALP